MSVILIARVRPSDCVLSWASQSVPLFVSSLKSGQQLLLLALCFQARGSDPALSAGARPAFTRPCLNDDGRP